jgi:hypothetical protein
MLSPIQLFVHTLRGPAMPKKAFVVELTADEQTRLQTLVTTGSSTAHASIHARILLKADTGRMDLAGLMQ